MNLGFRNSDLGFQNGPDAVALAEVSANPGQAFREEAKTFVLEYLLTHGRASGEEITDACKRAGFTPPDDRAFGPVYNALSRQGKIEKVDVCLRRKGHRTTGGNVWKLRGM